MWIFFQIFLFILMILSAAVLPKTIYKILVGAITIFTWIQIFVPWLFLVQMCTIILAANYGREIINVRDEALREVARINGIRHIVYSFSVVGNLLLNFGKKIKDILLNIINISVKVLDKSPEWVKVPIYFTILLIIHLIIILGFQYIVIFIQEIF